MIGLSVCNDVPSVAAPGSRKAVTGTNPLAYAIPAGDRDPIFFDAAISTVAGGKVYAARALGKSIPPDWLIGPDGRPTSDASLYPEHASLAPMSGHKGYGLALLVETLSSLATGAAMTHQVGSWIFGDLTQPTRHGAAFIAMDVSVIAPPGEFKRRVDELIDEIHAAPTADGIERVLVPGEREWANLRQSSETGILLPPDVAEKLLEAARESGLQPPWSTNPS
jgi:LDH2 family malate/lactate/ureidoglycolate dehydrogenase